MSDAKIQMTNEAGKTFTFVGRSRGTASKMLTEADHATVNKELSSGKFANKTQAVEYLLGLGWSDSQIAAKVRYESDTTGHNAGDPMKVQHVNHIRRRWNEKKAEAKPTPTPAPVSELRKS